MKKDLKNHSKWKKQQKLYKECGLVILLEVKQDLSEELLLAYTFKNALVDF
jgi:hypothetical protein